MYLTAAMTGMRIGELQALDWHGVDFVHARVRVRRTWDRKTKTFTTPKSRRSERAIPMPDIVAGHLDRLFKGSSFVEANDLVFADPSTGEPLGHRRMYERLRAALKAAGLDKSYGFHSLRHSYGTALAAEGVPMRTLQEWMGHRDLQRNSTHLTAPARAECHTRDLVRVPPPELSRAAMRPVVVVDGPDPPAGCRVCVPREPLHKSDRADKLDRAAGEPCILLQPDRVYLLWRKW